MKVLKIFSYCESTNIDIINDDGNDDDGGDYGDMCVHVVPISIPWQARIHFWLSLPMCYPSNFERRSIIFGAC